MTVVVHAPAKLTLTLRITGVRADGYHLIDAEMTTLDFGDVLTIHPGGTGIAVDGWDADSIPTDDSNLVAKALRLAQRSARVSIDKHIPSGGGLGGGSADAAAVLRWAGFDDLEAAASIGADVPFCLVGGRARVGGAGEIVTPLAALPGRVLTLIIPPLSCSTPAVYRAWDELGGPHDDGPNDLLPAALHVEPRLADWRARIRDAAGTEPALAGSGAAWFVEGHRPDIAAQLPGAIVRLTTTLA